MTDINLKWTDDYDAKLAVVSRVDDRNIDLTIVDSGSETDFELSEDRQRELYEALRSRFGTDAGTDDEPPVIGRVEVFFTSTGRKMGRRT